MARPCSGHAGPNTLPLSSSHPLLETGALPRDREPPPGWGLVLAASPSSSLQFPMLGLWAQFIWLFSRPPGAASCAAPHFKGK